jgi:predicted nucleic acid-binding Zn ribbon protein
MAFDDPMRKRAAVTRRVGEPLGELLRGLGLDRGVRAAQALRAWRDVAGEVVGRHARAQKCDAGVLTLSCDDPAWMHTLAMQREEWRRRLNERIGAESVKELRFELARTREKRKKAPPPLDPRKVAEAEAMAARLGVRDDAVREALARAMARAKARGR